MITLVATLLVAFPLQGMSAAEPNRDAGYATHLRGAYEALEEGRLDDARAALDACQLRSPENPTCAYYRACVEARAGELDEALANLRQAVDRGFEDAALLAWDPDLEPLRDEPTFLSMLEALEASEVSEEELQLELVQYWGTMGPELSGDGTLLLTSSSRKAFLRDVETGECLAVFPGFAVFVNDDRQIATYNQGVLRLWDGRTGAFERDVVDEERKTGAARTNASGTLFVVDEPSGGSDRVWRTDDWTLVMDRSGYGWTLPLPGDRVVVLRPSGDVDLHELGSSEQLHRWELEPLWPAAHWLGSDGRWLCVKSTADALFLLDLETFAEPVPFDASEYAPWGFVPGTDKFLLTQRGHVFAWDYVRGGCAPKFELPTPKARLEPSPDGRFVAAIGSFKTWIFERETGRVVRELDFGGFDQGTVWTANGLLLSLWFRIVHLVQGESLLAQRFTDLTRQIHATTFCSDRPTAVLACADGTVRFLGLDSGEVERILPVHSVACDDVAIEPQGRLLATASRDGLAKVWSLETNELVHSLDAGYESSYELANVRFDPSGRWLLTFGSGAHPSVWDARTGERLARVEPSTTARCGAWGPEGETFAIGEKDGTVTVFGVDGRPRGQPLIHAREIWHLAFDPSGEILAVGTRGAIATTWDVVSDEKRHVLSHEDQDIFQSMSVAWVAFSPDGSRVVTTSRGYAMARCWDVETGRLEWTVDFGGGNPATLRAVFGPDGERVYLSGNGGTRVVEISSGETIHGFKPFSGLLEPSPDGRFVLLRQYSSLLVLDAESFEKIHSVIETPGGGHLQRASSGHVDGNAAALARIPALLGTRSYPLDSFAAAVFDPKRCEAQRAGVVVSAPRIGTPPTLRVEPGDRVLTSQDGTVSVTIEAEDPNGLVGVELELVGRAGPVLLDGMEWLDEEKTRGRRTWVLNGELEPVTIRMRAVGRSGLVGRPHLVTVRRE